MAQDQKRDPPDLQQLVLDHGTYDKITPEAWERFGREMKEWQAKVRFGELRPPLPPRRRGPSR